MFINDNGVTISVPDGHSFTEEYRTRINQERYFRLISNYMISSGYVRRNIIDLGAWIGDNSIPWAMNLANGGGIVYSIDPSEYNCEYIGKVAEMNNISNIKIINHVISDGCKVVSTVDTDPRTDIYGGKMHHLTFSNDDSQEIRLNAVSLDYLYEGGEIGDIDYIHLDVEFMERLVIEGSVKVIERYQPIIAYEQHLDIDDYESLVKILNRRGYDVYIIDERFNNYRYDYRNLIALPSRIDSEQFKNEVESELKVVDLLKRIVLDKEDGVIL